MAPSMLSRRPPPRSRHAHSEIGGAEAAGAGAAGAELGATEDLDGDIDEPDVAEDAGAGAATARRGSPAASRRKGRGETASE